MMSYWQKPNAENLFRKTVWSSSFAIANLFFKVYRTYYAAHCAKYKMKNFALHSNFFKINRGKIAMINEVFSRK